MVRKLHHSYDVQKIQSEVEFALQEIDIQSLTVKQVLLTCPEYSTDFDFHGTGKIYDTTHKKYIIPQEDFKVFNPRLKDSYLEHIWKTFPYRVGRVRIMMLTPKRSYTLHRDAEPRFHIAVHTSPECYLIYQGLPNWYHVPADGHLYRVESYHHHSAMNCTNTLRTHIVFDSLEPYSV